MEKTKQIPYRAIALDLDGTLTNHEKVVTPKTREALLQASAKGAVTILASGRPTYGIEPVAECLELQKRGGYILSYNGGNIVNAQTGGAETDEVISKAKAAGIPVLEFTELVPAGETYLSWMQANVAALADSLSQ